MQKQSPTANSHWLDSILFSPGPDFPLPATFRDSNPSVIRDTGLHDANFIQSDKLGRCLPTLLTPNKSEREKQQYSTNALHSYSWPPSTRALSSHQPNAALLPPTEAIEQPVAHTLHKVSSNDSSGSHHNHNPLPTGSTALNSLHQPTSLPAPVLQQQQLANPGPQPQTAGRRVKRHRPPAVNKLREAEGQIADLTKQIRAVELRKESLQLRNRLLERDLQTIPSPPVSRSDAFSQMVDDNTRRLVESELGHKCEVGFRLPGSSNALTRKQVMHMTQQELKDIRGRYSRAFADVLLECSSTDTSSPAAKRLEGLVADEFRLQCWFALSRRTIEEFRSYTANPAHNAAELLKTIGLSPRQSAALRMLRRVYARNLGPLLAERKRVYATLQDLGPPLDGCGARPPEAAAPLERIQQLLVEEHSLLVALNLGLWRKVITPFQYASLQLHMHPAVYCEAFDMVDGLAKDAGEPEFSVLLEEAASLPTAVTVPMDSAIMAVPDFLAANCQCGGDVSDVLRSVWLLLGFQAR